MIFHYLINYISVYNITLVSHFDLPQWIVGIIVTEFTRSRSLFVLVV